MKIAKIAIFPGHVGKDSGAIDRVDGHEDDNLMTIESVINGQVAVLLKSKLDNLGISSEIYIGSLHDRLRANTSCDLGISLHCDSFSNPNAEGFTIFHYPGSIKGISFSKVLKHNLILSVNAYLDDRGIKSHSYYILSKTKFACILLEMGFLTNLYDEKNLNSYKVQNLIAHTIANSIIEMGGGD